MRVFCLGSELSDVSKEEDGQGCTAEHEGKSSTFP